MDIECHPKCHPDRPAAPPQVRRPRGARFTRTCTASSASRMHCAAACP